MNVLVVEDDPVQAEMMTHLIRAAADDARVTTARTVVKAVMAMVADRIDVAFVDWLLRPDYPLTGLDVARWLHEADPSCIICLVTGFERYELVGQGHAIPGWVTFITKPIDTAALTSVLGRVR